MLDFVALTVRLSGFVWNPAPTLKTRLCEVDRFNSIRRSRLAGERVGSEMKKSDATMGSLASRPCKNVS